MLLECTNEELVEIEEEILDTETIYSIVGIKEGKENLDSENEDLINELTELDLSRTEFMDKICEHEWKKNSGLDSIRCFKCKWFLDRLHRAKCKKCYLDGCFNTSICLEEYFNTSLSIERDEYQENIKTFSLDEKVNRLEQDITVLKEGYNDLNIKFVKHIGKKKLGEILEEIMNEENNNIIIHPIETCNKFGEIKASQIECTIRI